jgi:hypothetical protein
MNEFKRTIPLNNIPHVKDCIKYMNSTGWIFQYYNNPWYVFKHPIATTWAGSSELTPTLTELRDMYKNGF